VKTFAPGHKSDTRKRIRSGFVYFSPTTPNGKGFMDTTTQAIHELISRSDRCSFAVLGHPQTWDHVLIELHNDGTPMPSDALSDAHAKGYEFAGVWGLDSNDGSSPRSRVRRGGHHACILCDIRARAL